MGAGGSRFIWLGQVHIFLHTFLLFTPFPAIVLESTNFKPSWVFHLAWFFLAEFYCFLSVYFSFISQYTVCSTPAFGHGWGMIAFQPPGKRSYKLSDHESSFVLDSPGLAWCSGTPTEYPFENGRVPLGWWIIWLPYLQVCLPHFPQLTSVESTCVLLVLRQKTPPILCYSLWAYLQSGKVPFLFYQGKAVDLPRV